MAAATNLGGSDLRRMLRGASTEADGMTTGSGEKEVDEVLRA
jgi:hypothetical protein